MAMNQNVFLHETDRAAMEALQAIPGFSQVMKAFLSSWSEKAMYIENMASHIRISEEQYPEYDAMLKEVAGKMGIEKPDLFLKLDVVPNAYTSGETRPFIVITSALLEMMPKELLPTVLAHECGHIVCHHVLYRTMGTWVLSGALSLVPLGAIAIYPIMAAFHRWMRCSELSADRAAILCDGSADHLVEMCMRFAGGDSRIAGSMNKEAFMKQAEEYKRLVSDSKYNKTLEFMRFSQATHPINAVRALEGVEWTQTEAFAKAKAYFTAYQTGQKPESLPVSWNERTFSGRDVNDVREQLGELGFTNVTVSPVVQKGLFVKENAVTAILANEKDSWISPDAEIILKYAVSENAKERTADAGIIRLARSDSWYGGQPFKEAERDLRKEGFVNIIRQSVSDLADVYDPDNGKVFTVSINGKQVFRRGDTFPRDAEVIITYHTAV